MKRPEAGTGYYGREKTEFNEPAFQLCKIFNKSLCGGYKFFCSATIKRGKEHSAGNNSYSAHKKSLEGTFPLSAMPSTSAGGQRSRSRGIHL